MSFIMVKHISKTFKVSEKSNTKFATLKDFFNRKYKYIKAIDDISFSIKKGEIVGYIGPNGAGKSTTIKILSGILYPDSGTVVIDNMVPYLDRKKYVSQIGVVFGQRSQLWWDVPAIDSFKLLKDIYKIDDQSFNETLNELIKTLNLKDIINIPVRQLSLGSRMRLEIAAALLHKPKILFLDEPTIGLDAVSKKIVRDFIKKINKEQKVKYDVIVINDGSTDNTENILNENKIRHITLIHNLGIGGAVQTGYKYAYENNYDIAVPKSTPISFEFHPINFIYINQRVINPSS